MALVCAGVHPARAEEHDPWRLGIDFQGGAAGFDLDPRGVSGSRLSYRPAESDYVGVVLGYRWLAGTISFAIPATEQVRKIEGESHYRDYRLSYFFPNMGAEASYSRYMGYLIDNSAALSPATLNGQTYYKLPDMETLGYGLSLFYIISPGDYNLAAALDQSEIQEKSGGAWILIGTWRYQKITSNWPWIPTEKQPVFGVDELLRFSTTNTYGVGGGYAYNWVPSEMFFLSGLLALSFGYEDVNYITQVVEQSKNGVGSTALLRIILGMNTRDFILTLGGYLDYYNVSTQSVSIGHNIHGGTLTAVVRF
jgi:hypothetical protein